MTQRCTAGGKPNSENTCSWRAAMVQWGCTCSEMWAEEAVDTADAASSTVTCSLRGPGGKQDSWS